MATKPLRTGDINFHKKLLKLIKQAHRGGACPACVMRELICAAEAVALLSGTTSADLRAHGIPMLEPIEEPRKHFH